MWLIGLIAGAGIGAMGNFGGALLGAIAGAIVGGVLSRQSKVAAEARIATLEEALRKLAVRVGVLEGGAAAVPEEVAAHRETAPTATGMAAAPAAADMSGVVLPAVASPAVEASAAPAAEETQAQPAVATGIATAAVPVPALPRPAAASTASTVAAAAAVPRRPSAIRQFFFGGNTLVRVGMLVLFIGVSFLLKYAADHGFVPIELRLAGVAAGAIALLVLGWRLRDRRAGYALMLQGGGIGILFLTVFAAFKLYALIPPTLAFGLLAGIAFFSAVLAIVQDSRALAITGTAGGFLAPILSSSGGGSHVALFSYYAVLNAGVLYIAFYKAWRELNLVGFAFTALIGLMWGAGRYQPDYFSTTEPFLVLFFLMYVTIAVLFAMRQAPRLTHYVDGTMVFGVPLVAFGMQAAMVKDAEFGAAFSALAVAALYLTLAMRLQRTRESLRLLIEAFLALGVGFATLAVPLALDARWTSAIWAVEGAAIFWIGMRQQRRLARVFGMLLQIAAGVSFLIRSDGALSSEQLLPLLNGRYLGCVMVSVAALFINAYVNYAARSHNAVGRVERLAARGLFVWGLIWWLAGGIAEVARHLSDGPAWTAALIFFAGSGAVFGTLWQRLRWPEARYAALLVLPLAAVSLLMMAADGSHQPFADHGYVAWLLVFAVHLWVLRRHRGSVHEQAGWLQWWHAGGFWLLTAVLSWAFAWQVDHYVDGQRVWPLVAYAVVPGALIAAFALRGADLAALRRWPLAAHPRAYFYLGAMPVALYLLLWSFVANFISDGNPAPLPYVPLLNPLDLAQSGALLAIVMWFVHLKRAALPAVKLPAVAAAWTVFGAVLFVALNGVLLRTLHHYADVPFDFDRMMASTLVQASFSLFWSLLALSAMVFANKRGLRTLWLVGAALLAVVIAKLALVDLSSSGTVERIVSFIGVGLFCMVVGYFAPVPPAKRVAREGAAS